jgi:transcriptional regulator with XRE-family HTH domain
LLAANFPLAPKFAVCNLSGMMTLSTYLASTGETQAAFAERIGIKPPHMSLILSGARLPSIIVAGRIERETGGKVPASSWVSSEREAS